MKLNHQLNGIKFHDLTFSLRIS